MKVLEVKTERYNGLACPILSIEEVEKELDRMDMVYNIDTLGKFGDFVWVAANDLFLIDIGETEESTRYYLEKFNQFTARIERMYCKSKTLVFYVEVTDESFDQIKSLQADRYELSLFAPTNEMFADIT